MNSMTKKWIIFSLALLAQAVMAAGMLLSKWAMTIIWKYLLEGEALAFCTDISLKYGMIIPAVGALAVIAIGCRAKSQSDDIRFYATLLIVTATTLIMSALYIAGIVLPALTITWTLS
ncbi:MAG TPA: hypothetical protein PLE77_13515 [Kiritimatiellia bacterium]|nr:hypothetical protein [Kiritimatiellia bacterium]